MEKVKEVGEYGGGKGVEMGLWREWELDGKEGVEGLVEGEIVKEVGDGGVGVLKREVGWVGGGYCLGLKGVGDVGEIMGY